jgi:hypothetical protein
MSVLSGCSVARGAQRTQPQHAPRAATASPHETRRAALPSPEARPPQSPRGPEARARACPGTESLDKHTASECTLADCLGNGFVLWLVPPPKLPAGSYEIVVNADAERVSCSATVPFDSAARRTLVCEGEIAKPDRLLFDGRQPLTASARAPRPPVLSPPRRQIDPSCRLHTAHKPRPTRSAHSRLTTARMCSRRG